MTNAPLSTGSLRASVDPVIASSGKVILVSIKYYQSRPYDWQRVLDNKVEVEYKIVAKRL